MMGKILIRIPPTSWMAWLLFAALAIPNASRAQSPNLQFTQVSSRTDIVDIVNAADGSGRLFLVQQPGLVFILEDGEELGQPFLDIRDRVRSGGEWGLLSLAFAPDYASSGYFYTWYTDRADNTILARFRVSEDANIADPESETEVLRLAQPFGNHNGGRLQFGPDGMLYLGTGDGGGSFDPEESGQDPDSLLGKLIRIDVNPAHGTYAIPPDNPFVTDASYRAEIWALGLRNPWRISFDRGTGDLFIADVGQNEREEVNFQPARGGGGQNYGWSIMEGSQCLSQGCDQSGLTLPVAEYTHGEGCSVTGGEVYRGQAYGGLRGVYLYGDYCSGRIWGLSRQGGQWQNTLLADSSFAIITFGQGEDGSLYVSSQPDGVFLISDGSPVTEPEFGINAGFNDVWLNPETAGQGLLVAAFPVIEQMFVAWFTFDIERPPQGTEASIGEPGHRWLTAQGPYQGDTAILDIYVTSGGVFDSAEPAAGPSVKDGTMTIRWTDCNTGLVSYTIDSAGVQGVIPIERATLDNVGLCESLQ
jgi:glucose/arabinose dehydrogenase